MNPYSTLSHLPYHAGSGGRSCARPRTSHTSPR